MTPLDTFKDAWARCDAIAVMHAYLAANRTQVLNTDELLRSEWVARVSALDLYVHELVTQRMTLTFLGNYPPTQQYDKFQMSLEASRVIAAAPTKANAAASFELEVRRQLGLKTFQLPDAIADAVRNISSIQLWNAIAAHQGATPRDQAQKAKAMKTTLSIIVDRRNKIAHEADMQPGYPRTAWPILATDLTDVRIFIERLVNSIDVIV